MIFNDFVSNNPDAKITPTELVKWSALPKWNKYGIGKLQRYVFYTELMKNKIAEYNNLPYLLRLDEIDEATPFNFGKIIDKYIANPNKLKKALENVEKRANIILEIALEAENLKKELSEVKDKNMNLESEIINLKNKISYYKNYYENLLFDSAYKSQREEKNIKSNILNISEREEKDVADEFKIKNIEHSVQLNENNEETDNDIIEFLKRD